MALLVFIDDGSLVEGSETVSSLAEGLETVVGMIKRLDNGVDYKLSILVTFVALYLSP